ncbi:NAD(P)H-flavin reductase [Actinopolymorpha cephalotaxi]|uniref:nitric oxide dioxygenase n=1 Tax=Actinopolymorpha cephalotaxi TaxID=504797 RepID=A0A1I2K6A8_9ACTN|nr:globin domain-containing protein [Actinopolymorpha cephalotaxi]NYH85905.1 NAD(P)H-flavin reductase/hemoglobin-like flavoprotein [Actinopolymorpha cephalotaxi]SFF62715.1 NAD(P)H-flavin reductase [Actinopolymorpha cephalotaxi]
MDPAALQGSWQIVAKSGDDVPLFFYSHLFLSHPELRELFPISMAAQRDKLVGALGSVVSSVDRLEEVVPLIQQLGREHRRFSVVAEHYGAVGASLLATLKHFLGPAWTPELAADWSAAYGLIARTMVEAAEAAADTPAWWTAEVTAIERRTLDVSVLRLQPQEHYDYRAGQSFAMEIPQRPRLWRYFSPANAPRRDGSIELHVQLVDGGQVSTSIVRSTKVGDTVRLGAPIGTALTLPDDFEGDLLMVAGGTGLAPLRAVLEQLDRRWQVTGRTPRTHLFHGVRMPWSLYERELLSQLANRPWFDYTEAVSDDSSYPGARGPVGTVAARGGSWQGRTAMVCGSPAMVEHTVARLAEAGIPREHIRFESFGAAGDVNHSQQEASRQGDGQ